MKIVEVLKSNIGNQISLWQTIGGRPLNYHGELMIVNDQEFRMKTNTGFTKMCNVWFKFKDPNAKYFTERRLEVDEQSFDLLELFNSPETSVSQ